MLSGFTRRILTRRSVALRAAANRSATPITTQVRTPCSNLQFLNFSSSFLCSILTLAVSISCGLLESTHERKRRTLITMITTTGLSRKRMLKRK